MFKFQLQKWFSLHDHSSSNFFGTYNIFLWHSRKKKTHQIKALLNIDSGHLSSREGSCNDYIPYLPFCYLALGLSKGHYLLCQLNRAGRVKIVYNAGVTRVNIYFGRGRSSVHVCVSDRRNWVFHPQTNVTGHPIEFFKHVILHSTHLFSFIRRFISGCLCGVIVKAMDSGIIVSEFELQSRYYIYFRANTFGKGMNPLILPTMG